MLMRTQVSTQHCWLHLAFYTSCAGRHSAAYSSPTVAHPVYVGCLAAASLMRRHCDVSQAERFRTPRSRTFVQLLSTASADRSCNAASALQAQHAPHSWVAEV